jgi:hypothetical protein
MYSALVYHDVSEGMSAGIHKLGWEHKLGATDESYALLEAKQYCARPGDVVEVWLGGAACVGGWDWDRTLDCPVLQLADSGE